MKITGISAQKRSTERVNVQVDGVFRLAVSQEVLLRSGLARGDAVTEEQLATLEREDQQWRAREAALDLLSYRIRSVAELKRRLVRKDFPPDVADACVAALVEAGLLDDTLFAESFIRDRINFRPRGRAGLARELRANGVDAETAEAAIGEVLEREDVSELDLAREVAARFAVRTGEDPLRARRRLYGRLARRGFSGDTARQVMEELGL
jgi:regulatory protein